LVIIQRICLLSVFFGGVVLLFFNIKKDGIQSSFKTIKIVFIILGVVAVIYSGIILFLVNSLDNIGL
jgi:hypothetical protein